MAALLLAPRGLELLFSLPRTGIGVLPFAIKTDSD
jgi:hypothetical protein